MDKAFFDAWSPRALGLLRIVVGYLYIRHRTAKLRGFPHQAMFDIDAARGPRTTAP